MASYIIVHPSAAYAAQRDDPHTDSVIREISRIIRREDCVILEELADEQVSWLDRGQLLLVCGAFYTGHADGMNAPPMCVDYQLMALRKAGYEARVHLPGTLRGLPSWKPG